MFTKKVSIIILNYNGRYLMEKYLPSIVASSKRSKHDCKVVVIDNKSTDESIPFLKRNYPEVVLCEAAENKVLCSYNEYLKRSDEDIVIFLNNDIRVDESFVDPLIEHFMDEKVFFVAPKELSINEGKYQGNLNRIKFHMGFLSTSVDSTNCEKFQNDASVHGGAFDRNKYLELGGYDDMYLPGIVEDFDLCYRAWKHGWKGLYDPRSYYYHEGSTSFKANYKTDQRSILAHRNSFLFFWKNVTSWKLMFLHIITVPVILTVSLLLGKWIIIKAFFRAVKMMPLAISRRRNVAGQFLLTDEEVIRKANTVI